MSCVAGMVQDVLQAQLAGEANQATLVPVVGIDATLLADKHQAAVGIRADIDNRPDDLSRRAALALPIEHKWGETAACGEVELHGGLAGHFIAVAEIDDQPIGVAQVERARMGMLKAWHQKSARPPLPEVPPVAPLLRMIGVLDEGTHGRRPDPEVPIETAQDRIFARRVALAGGDADAPVIDFTDLAQRPARTSSVQRRIEALALPWLPNWVTTLLRRTSSRSSRASATLCVSGFSQ